LQHRIVGESVADLALTVGDQDMTVALDLLVDIDGLPWAQVR
jgi:hypothetical protein